jgi:hypothetical protein
LKFPFHFRYIDDILDVAARKRGVLIYERVYFLRRRGRIIVFTVSVCRVRSPVCAVSHCKQTSPNGILPHRDVSLCARRFVDVRFELLHRNILPKVCHTTTTTDDNKVTHSNGRG